jgi:hypothetical protein
MHIHGDKDLIHHFDTTQAETPYASVSFQIFRAALLGVTLVVLCSVTEAMFQARPGREATYYYHD